MVAGPDATLIGVLNRDWDQPSSKDWAEVLARLPLFAGVGKRQLRRIAGLAQVRDYDMGDTIVKEGGPADGFYLILEGRARVATRRPRTLQTGDYFGEMALLDGEPRSATVSAVGSVRAMRLPRRPFLQLLQKEPSIAVALLTELSGRVRRLQKSD
jgi:CRP-like cAMP-binding protein